MHNSSLRKAFVETLEDRVYSKALNHAPGDDSILNIEHLQMI